jgi:uncharacterized repeat protein (TIGR01451 family)
MPGFRRSVRLNALILLALVCGLAWPFAPAQPTAQAATPPNVAYVYKSDTASRDSFKAALELRGFVVTPRTLAEAATFDFNTVDIIIIGHDTGEWNDDVSRAALGPITRAEKYTVGVGFGGGYFFGARGLQIDWLGSWIANGASAVATNPADQIWSNPNPVPLSPDRVARLYNQNVPYLAVFDDPASPLGPNVSRIGRQVANDTHYPIISERFRGQFGFQCNLLWGFTASPGRMTAAGRDLFENLLRNDPCARRVAYVYNDDTAARDSYTRLLNDRGLAVDAVTLGASETWDFKPYLAIIIADDTNVRSGWGGSPTALDNIKDAGKPIVGVARGGYFFFNALSLAIGNNGVAAAGKEVTVVDGDQPVYDAPYPIAAVTGAALGLYTSDSPLVGINLPAPPPANVTPIGRFVTEKQETVYPLIAERTQENRCYALWGFALPPTTTPPTGGPTVENMTALARDLFLDMLLGQSCGRSPAASADLRIAKIASPNPVVAGNNLVYKLIIANAGPNDAPNVKVVDILPAGVTFVSATPSQGMCSQAAGVVTCLLGLLPAGAPAATVKIVVTPTQSGKITNTARVTSRVADPNGANNSASVETTVNPAPTIPPVFALPYKPIFTGPVVFFPGEDLSIYGIEITQGIQCFDATTGLTDCADNTLPLVAQKDTTARIYLRYNGLGPVKNNVPVRLVIIANGVTYTANTSAKARSTLSRANTDDSANIYFNVNFAGGIDNVQFYAIVDPNNTMTETNEGNNRFPPSGNITLSFSKRKTMKIVSQRLDYHPSGYSSTRLAGGWAVNGGGAQWFEQLLPVKTGGINHQVASGYLDWTTQINSDGQHALIKNLNARWILQNVFAWLFGSGAFTGARHVYGWVPGAAWSGGHADMPVYPHAGGLGVVGIGTDIPGTSTDNPGAGALIMGHELVHDYNVKHTDVPGDCGSSDSTSDFPYASASIQEFGFNPITGKVYNPSNTHDLMSYCPAGGSKEGWISPFTWTRMYNLLAATSLSTEAVPAATSTASLAVNAVLNNPALGPGTGTFGDLHLIDAPVPETELPAGDYRVELRDRDGKVLQTKSFNVDFSSEYKGGEHPLLRLQAGVGDPDPTAVATMSFVMPWVDGTTSVVLLRNSDVLATRTVSANAPLVQITSPSAPVSWPAGTSQTLSWNATDPDGDSLRYSVLYSKDGSEWELLADGLTTTSYSVPVDSLAGGANARFKVVATDGVNIGDDQTSAPISVPDKAPVAQISSLSSGVVAPGELLVLEGFGADLEDGILDGASLAWSSDRQGALGNGTTLPTNSLNPGLHTITLMVNDSSGQTATATTTVYVGYRLPMPNVNR